MGEHFAEDYSVIMGLVDLLPVVLFALGGCIIIKELFNELKKPFAVMLCSGVTLSLTAGVFKATWKILLALNVCDFYPFNVMFLPTQSLGFILIGVGLLSLLFLGKGEKKGKVNAIVWPLLIAILAGTPAQLVDGSIAFIAMLCIGDAMIATALSYLAVKNKQWASLVLFIVFFVFLIIMGAMKPLSTKMGLGVTEANWIEESINIVAQGSFFVGSYLLSKKGFFAFRNMSAPKR